MLLVPLATGAMAGYPSGERILWILLFAAVALGLFCLRTPVEAWLGISTLRPQNEVERRIIYTSTFMYAFVSCVSLAVLMRSARAYGLLLLGAAAATFLLLQAYLKQLGKATRMNAQLTGALALTCTGPGAYYLATGRLDRSALFIWAANWLFAANQIHFVKVRIHSAHALTPAERFISGRSFLLQQSATVLGLGLAWRAGWVPGLLLFAFIPVFYRGIAWFLESPRPLQVHRLGRSEMVYAVVFGLTFIASYHLRLA